MVSVAKFDQWQSTAGVTRNAVLQIVQGYTSTAVFSSSATFADTGLTATITPSSATSKILILVEQADPYKSVNNTSNAINLSLVRNSTTIVYFAAANGYTGTAMQNNTGSIGTVWLDSPGTTSPVTYKTQFANYAGSAVNVGVQSTGSTSTIILMEIAA